MKCYFKETMKYLLRCYPVIRLYIKEIDRMYDMSNEQIRSRNEQRFLGIFRKAYSKSSFYRELYTREGIELEDIKSLDDIKKLPVITKEMIKQHALEMITVPKWKLLSNRTSGTTGTPLTVYESWDSIWREQAYFYCYRKRCGYVYGETLASLRGNLGKKDTVMYVHISHTLFLSSYNINSTTAELYYKALLKKHPKAIEGYPSSLYNLARVFADKGYTCNIPLCFTSSENLMDYQRYLIEKQFNTQVYDHYGTTERSIRLSENFDHDGYFEDPGYSVNEYTDDGEVTTSLINSSFPLIRYKSYDIIELKESVHGCKRNFIKKINGRSVGCIKGKDGSVYNNAALTFILTYSNNIRYAQFIQEKSGKLILNIVTDKKFDSANMDELRSLIDRKVGLSNFDLEICEIEEKDLIYTSRNKFNYVISHFE